MQHISEQKSNRIVLKTGWTRDEGVCSQSGPGERRHQACPRNSHSPQGPVAQFYKEPKMIRPVAKLFFRNLYLCKDCTARNTGSHSWFTFSIFETGRPAFACRWRLLPEAGRGWRRDILAESSGGISASSVV